MCALSLTNHFSILSWVYLRHKLTQSLLLILVQECLRLQKHLGSELGLRLLYTSKKTAKSLQMKTESRVSRGGEYHYPWGSVKSVGAHGWEVNLQVFSSPATPFNCCYWGNSCYVVSTKVTLLCFLSIPEVVTKYSNFISFPLYLNGRRINTLQVRWGPQAGHSWRWTTGDRKQHKAAAVPGNQRRIVQDIADLVVIS